MLLAQQCPPLCRLQPAKFLHPRDSPGKNTGVGCHFLLQEFFPTQGLNLGLPHCRQTLYSLSHQGSLYEQSKLYYIFFFFLFNVKLTFILGNKFISKFTKIHSLFYILPNSSSSCSVAKFQPWDCSLSGCTVYGIFQARILEWVVIFFSRASFRSRDRT